MKILYLITKSNYGGAQKYVFELAVAAQKAGHTVAVACGGTGSKEAGLGILATKLAEVGLRVLPVKNFMRDMSLGRDVLAFIEVLLLLRRERPDVLHVTSSKAGAIGAAAGRLAGVPKIIFTSHGLTMDETWRPRWQRLLITIGTWLTIRLCHHSIMINSETYERTHSLPHLEGRVSLIKNGVAPIHFLDTAVARAKLAPQLPSSTFWIGGIGELHPNKNWASLIHALATLPKEVHLLIVGEGEERTQLELLIENLGLSSRVHLLGYLDTASQYFKAFDIFVLPSKKEGLPYVLLEAGLAGLPVIASDLPGNRDIIETGMTGLLVEPTSKMLSTTLQFLMRDEGVKRRLGTSLREYVTNEFSIQEMTEKTFALYTSSNSLV